MMIYGLLYWDAARELSEVNLIPVGLVLLGYGVILLGAYLGWKIGQRLNPLS